MTLPRINTTYLCHFFEWIATTKELRMNQLIHNATRKLYKHFSSCVLFYFKCSFFCVCVKRKNIDRIHIHFFFVFCIFISMFWMVFCAFIFVKEEMNQRWQYHTKRNVPNIDLHCVVSPYLISSFSSFISLE